MKGDWILRETLLSLNADKLFPPAQGQSLPEGKEAACVLGEEMLILALILKGPGRSIALSSLRKREINMFLKAKQAACGVCVWASLIPPDVFREKLFLKKNDHISRSSAFISNTYLQKSEHL